ncbi:hypothetical protein NE237_031463 [Protea cynaroides]|uniref:Transcription initiation factor TFIID subunit 13 n=1 Tax=Protea cynaroides TaxID=273540 RepID=A0A9Q0L263_9MAGN|nr:hypothetical protein NE237_031463 [Protea cynaroides]
MHNSSTRSTSKPKAFSSVSSDVSFKRKRGVFQKDLQHMMNGFGDDTNLLPETVALLEDIVIEYVTDMGKLLTEDFLFLTHKDFPELHRCMELLSMNEELKQERKAFEVDEEKLTAD